MKIAVMGTGGVGGYYGALLAQKKHDVSFIARGAHLQAIRKNGLQIKSAFGDFAIKPAKATDQPAQVGPVDLLLFCTKTYDMEAAAKQAIPMVGAETTVLPLQNGLDAHERIGGIVGMQHMLAGATGISSAVEAPGIISQVSNFRWIVIGELDGKRTRRVEAVYEAFKETGADIQISEHILAELWRKLLRVSVYAAFGSVTRLPVGEYRSVPEMRPLMQGLLQEIADLAAADGQPLEADAVEKTLAGVDRAEPHIKSSMQLDFETGHRTELDSIVGVLCRKGRALGVATPVADTVYGVLVPIDAKAR